MSFTTGDPKLPGDNLFASGTFVDPFHTGYSLQNPIPLANTTDGFTITIFPPSGTPLTGIVAYISANKPGCGAATNFSFNPPFAGTLTMNGVLGTIANVPQQSIDSFVQQGFCGFTLADYSLNGVSFIGGPVFGPVDAVAFGLGQNNVPK